MKDGKCKRCGGHVPVWYFSEWCNSCLDAFAEYLVDHPDATPLAFIESTSAS